MDRDTWSGLIGASLFCLLSMGLMYSTYKLGRVFERKALTNALVESIQETYQEGYTDGYKKAVVDMAGA